MNQGQWQACRGVARPNMGENSCLPIGSSHKTGATREYPPMTFLAFHIPSLLPFSHSRPLLLPLLLSATLLLSLSLLLLPPPRTPLLSSSLLYFPSLPPLLSLFSLSPLWLSRHTPHFLSPTSPSSHRLHSQSHFVIVSQSLSFSVRRCVCCVCVCFSCHSITH